MKLLFDENLSPKLAGVLQDEYPGSSHVRGVGLVGQPDSKIWDHARDHGFIIVSKDDDFRQRSFVEGAPPKVVWLQVGNAGTRPIAKQLRAESERIRSFSSEDESSLLIVRSAV